MLRALRSVDPLQLIVLMMLFTTASSLVRTACRRRGPLSGGAPCRVSAAAISGLEAADLQFAAGATLLAYVAVQAYDRLAPRTLFA